MKMQNFSFSDLLTPFGGIQLCPIVLSEGIVERYRESLLCCEYASATVEKYVQIVQSFCSSLTDHIIKKETLLGYKKALISNYAATSVNGMLAAINNFLEFLGHPEYKVKPVKIQHTACRAEERELSEEEYRRLLEAAKLKGQMRLYHILETIGSTGIRVSEIQYITVESLEKGRAEVRNKGKSRTIFLPKALCSKLETYCSKHSITTGSVFVTRSGKPLDRSNIWAMMKRLCEAANVKASKVFPHNLRHLFARLFYERHHDLDHLAVILGHSNINTTRIYTQTCESEYQKQVEMLRLIS